MRFAIVFFCFAALIAVAFGKSAIETKYEFLDTVDDHSLFKNAEETSIRLL